MSKGYVKLHRKIKDSWITKDPAAFIVFFGYFLIRAAYEPYTTTVNGQKVALERGEVVGGRGMIAEAMNMTEKQVRMALVRLVRRETIRASTRASTRASNYTVYLVVNFDTYQGCSTDDGPALCDGHEMTRASFIEEVKEVKEKNRRFVPPAIGEVEAYCAERGGVVNAKKWHDFYTAKGWKVGTSSMKDWKAAVRTWEPEGHKPNQKVQLKVAY